MKLFFFAEKKEAEAIGFSTKKLEEAQNFFTENIKIFIEWKSNGKKYPKNIIPKNKEIKATNPLIEPFIEELNKLKSDGINKLPAWLAEQGEMAGCSWYFQDMYEYLKEYTIKVEEQKKAYEQYIKDNNIQNVPSFELDVYLREYLKELEIINRKIYKIGKSASDKNNKEKPPKREFSQ